MTTFKVYDNYKASTIHSRLTKFLERQHFLHLPCEVSKGFQSSDQDGYLISVSADSQYIKISPSNQNQHFTTLTAKTHTHTPKCASSS